MVILPLFHLGRIRLHRLQVRVEFGSHLDILTNQMEQRLVDAPEDKVQAEQFGLQYEATSAFTRCGPMSRSTSFRWLCRWVLGIRFPSF
jgi:hypothetical protein